MENKKKTGIGAILLSVIFLIWFFGSIAAMIYLSQNDKGALVVTVFGQVFLVFGLIAVISGIMNKQFQPITLIFPLVGIGCMAGGCIFQFGSETVIKYAEDALPYLFLCIFLIVGVSLVIGTYLHSKRLHEVCNYCITATCVKVKSHYSKGKRMYCPVYEVYFRGDMIQICNNVYTNMNHITVGESREIYLNPNKPTEFYEPKEEKSMKIVLYFLGILFTIVSIFALIMVLFLV